jgi:hypothetical protein
MRSWRRNQLWEVRSTNRIEGDACALPVRQSRHLLHEIDLFGGNHLRCTGFEQLLPLVDVRVSAMEFAPA